MTSSEDFKQALKAGKLTEALVVAMGEAIRLNITTSVVDASDDSNWLSQGEVKPGCRMHTQIDVVQGDINNEIGSRFLESDTYQQLRQFHLEQVSQGTKIIQDNLNSIRQILGIWLKIRQYNPSDAKSPLDVEEKNLIPPTDGESVTEQEVIESETPPEFTKEETPELSIANQPNLEPNLTPTDDYQDDDWIDGDDGISDLLNSFPPPEELEELSEPTPGESLPPTPTPEMPVSDLEIEDWEIASHSDSDVDDDWGDYGDNGNPEDVEIFSLEDFDVEQEESEEFLPEELNSEVAREFEQANYVTSEALLVENEQESVDLLPEELMAVETQDLATETPQIIVASEQEDDWGDLLVPESNVDTDEFGLPSSSISANLTSQITTANNVVDSEESEEKEDWDDLLPPASLNGNSFTQEPLEPLLEKQKQLIAQNKQASIDEEEDDSWLEDEWDELEVESAKSSSAAGDTQEPTKLNLAQGEQNQQDEETLETTAAEDDFGFLFAEEEIAADQVKSKPSSGLQSGWEEDEDELSSVFEDDLFGNFPVRRTEEESNQDRE